MNRLAWRWAIAAIAVIALVPGVGHAGQGMQCFWDKRVTEVYTGYAVGSKGGDYGDAVYFRLEDGATYPLNYSYNLDHNRGQALHRVLLTALVGRYKLSGYDHYADNCDDIDELMLTL